MVTIWLIDDSEEVRSLGCAVLLRKRTHGGVTRCEHVTIRMRRGTGPRSPLWPDECVEQPEEIRTRRALCEEAAVGVEPYAKPKTPAAENTAWDCAAI